MTTSPDPSDSELRSIRLAYRTRRYLLRITDVLGYAVGFRIRDGERTREPALVVYVREGFKRRDPYAVPRHRRVPGHVVVQARSGRTHLPVDIVEAAPGRLCKAFLAAGETVCNCEEPGDFGTIGWIARQADGTPVFCSCYHVLLPNAFPPGNPIQRFTHDPAAREEVTTPSVAFGGDTGLKTGLVMRGVRSHSADVAIGELQGDAEITGVISGLGPMGPPRLLRSGEIRPGEGEPVEVAVGFGGPVRGVLLEYPTRFPFDYPDIKGYPMENLIATSARVKGGHSGSVLVDRNNRPLGMLIGEDPVSERSFFMHISTVMGAFNLHPF